MKQLAALFCAVLLPLASFADAARSGLAADVHAPAANTAAVVTYAAVAGTFHNISALYWSYSGAPTAGTIKIEDVSGTVIFGPHAITAAGPGFLPFQTPFRSAAVNTAMIVTLSAGGAAVSGVVTARHWTD